MYLSAPFCGRYRHLDYCISSYSCEASLFREQEGYYLYDDRILYYQDYRWYEYSGSKWLETEDDIEKKEGIWSYKVPFADIRDEEPDIREISLARIWMEQ